MKFKSFLITILLLVISQTVFSQTDSLITEKKIVLIKMYEGEPIIGEILSDDGREILVLTQTKGKIYISKSLIKEISEIKDMKSSNDTEYSPEGPFTTRYAFTTNALPIKKNVNYAMVNLFGPEVHFAVTNNLSLGIL